MNTTREATQGEAPSPSPDGARRLRFVTAASLFDGHDAAINVMRRLIQMRGAEVVHLGHNRSVDEVVRAAVQEDADAIAVSSYQGGHVEYFSYMIEQLRERGAGHIRVFGGGGGTITPDEIRDLERLGVERIYHPSDGMRLGLSGMIDDVIGRVRTAAAVLGIERHSPTEIRLDDEMALGQALSKLEDPRCPWMPKAPSGAAPAPIIGITGTGGAGKSSVVDELLLRFLQAFSLLRIAVLAVDPTRRRSGGALLGDRIRMNSLRSPRVFMRSMATRRQNLATNAELGSCIRFLSTVGFGLVIVETAGVGQSDSEIVDLVDLPIYVMTSDYGAASQLEKIDMIDFARMIVLNKFDRRGAQDALRDVRKQWRRNHGEFAAKDDDVPIYPTIASQFNDGGVTRLFVKVCEQLRTTLALPADAWTPPAPEVTVQTSPRALIPDQRSRYLAEIAEQARGLERDIERQVEAAAQAQACWRTLGMLGDARRPAALEPYHAEDVHEGDDRTLLTLRARYQEALNLLPADTKQLLLEWPERLAGVTSQDYTYHVRDEPIRGSNYTESLSHQQVPKIAAPRFSSWSELLRFLLRENLPGGYPYTAGVYPYRRAGEDPARMFAGEGTPERTNRRFHYLSRGQRTARLSTAFDSVTLYGEDPGIRPDVYGKVGNSGVSIATLDDMKKLYSGFDLAAPTTSVSMTINGPAPIILAMFMNTAVDQAVEKYLRADAERWLAAQDTLDRIFRERPRPNYHDALPEGHDGLGLALLGVTGEDVLDRETYERIKADTMRTVRGTVQADILKEDQAQNTCIFSTEFALRMMGDVQQFFIDQQVRNFYSASVSGYHIAEAGANPITQLAFTLANGFTIVEYYLARGMAIDAVAPNLSFFFSNGMDAEYAVIGRVARRIWARAMRQRYGAGARSQMLKYHIQTSGRSLHAQEIQFNDIRTTLQALYALFDNCNSLHTNAYDEAITTPTEESVRRAVAVQLIIGRELGLNACENPWQGSFAIEHLTDMVEAAVYREFDALSERGGVLGAMDTMYQRSQVQEQSLYYEQKKHDGSLPLIGVNTFLPTHRSASDSVLPELIRSNDAEKDQQIRNVEAFRQRRQQGPHRGDGGGGLAGLQQLARQGGNVFRGLMDTVKRYSLGEIAGALYAVGGEYRRNM